MNMYLAIFHGADGRQFSTNLPAPNIEAATERAGRWMSDGDTLVVEAL